MIIISQTVSGGYILVITFDYNRKYIVGMHFRLLKLQNKDIIVLLQKSQYMHDLSQNDWPPCSNVVITKVYSLYAHVLTDDIIQ